MTTKRRLARIRRRLLEPDRKSCALWVAVVYMEPFGTAKYRVWAHFSALGDTSPIGEGRTIRAAVRDAERRIKTGDWADAEKVELAYACR